MRYIHQVSIHLMLLFICLCCLILLFDLRFNTSHVVIYLLLARLMNWERKCFNTSHVVIYRRRKNNGEHEFRVSIHLMLLFIIITERRVEGVKKVSIHLMLLFITEGRPNVSCSEVFQYISCCYLSCTICTAWRQLRTFQYISCCYLSGVSKSSIQECMKFQYISCCYLSEFTVVLWLVAMLFQYISCCYLSMWCSVYYYHVVTFQYISCCYLSRKQPESSRTYMRFNTSHVVIYLSCFVNVLVLFFVSIHLMLLFI